MYRHPCQTRATFNPASAAENFGEYLVHFETGKRIYQLYAELDAGDDNNPESLAVLLRDMHKNATYMGPCVPQSDNHRPSVRAAEHARYPLTRLRPDERWV